MWAVVGRVAEGEARQFLSSRYGRIEQLEPLAGGFWSSAYGFTVRGRPLVARFGQSRAFFEADRAAMGFRSAALPVPEVLEIGEAFGGHFAVSSRHYGMRLEDVSPEQSATSGPLLASLLRALYSVPSSPDLPVIWHSPEPDSPLTWRSWLKSGLRDDPGRVEHGWHSAIHEHPGAELVFKECEARLERLIASCPERRDLVHGDLLHANVLVTPDARLVTAVFSWKCSVRGDFLYDASWCTFWAPWHPGIEAADAWGRLRREPSIPAEAWVDDALRHHCYELHIGVAHLAWNLFIDNPTELVRVAERLEEILDRGPLRRTR